jgi:magnesium chelatase family protein
LIGGGAVPRPGEVSLSHGGVLFLDELPEFRKHVIEVLRQPMEDGSVTISRAATSLSYPARFMLAAAMNPCPCGYYGDIAHDCTCGPAVVSKYLGRVSGPLLDHIEVPAVVSAKLSSDRTGESSNEIRKRVESAYEIQHERFTNSPGVFANAHISAGQIRKYCKPTEAADILLARAINRLKLSARAYHRVLKIARTIADLSGKELVEQTHVAEAVQYRNLDRLRVG